jgi:hypothetical protein
MTAAVSSPGSTRHPEHRGLGDTSSGRLLFGQMIISKAQLITVSGSPPDQ